jgi:predicted GNAT family N-acyltransferase
MDSRIPGLTIAAAESPKEREQCFAVRVTVFVEEQKVPVELELDERDADAVHYLATIDGTPIGTARMVDYLDHGRRVAKIGRVAVLPAYRKQSIGTDLMKHVLEDARKRGFDEALLDSQTYVIGFYESLGFVAEGDEFLDANIPHYRMRLRL